MQQPPKYLDPTYRRPELALAEAAAASPSVKTLDGKDIRKSKLPEEIKRKLLEEVEGSSVDDCGRKASFRFEAYC